MLIQQNKFYWITDRSMVAHLNYTDTKHLNGRVGLRAAVRRHRSKSVSVGLICCGLRWTAALSVTIQRCWRRYAQMWRCMPLPIAVALTGNIVFWSNAGITGDAQVIQVIYAVTLYLFELVACVAFYIHLLFTTNGRRYRLAIVQT